ncbi:MAG TPA: fibronectin type III domain-containing protein, partial [Chthoniobacterales bacterium]|nr:fibronectin type III domain-containing protein [Chthoniobacterales bacterium]
MLSRRIHLQLFGRTACALATGAAAFLLCPEARASITVSTYPATAQAGVALENMSGSTQAIGPNVDDDPSSIKDIGFDFWFDGVRYTQFSVNPNGICRLGPSVIDGVFDNSGGFPSTDNAPKICPYFDDLQVGSNGQVHYKLVGTAPNRKLVIEWLNMQVPRVGFGVPGAGIFQLWLSETTGRVELVYGGGMVNNPDGNGYTVGLQSGAGTNFASVTTATSAVSYVTPNDSQIDAIAAGRSFRFSPLIPAAPTTLTFTTVTPTSMRLNWVDNATNEVGYVIYRSIDNVVFNFITQTGPNTNFHVASSLSPATTYFWRVYAVSQGGLSNVLAGSKATTTPITITAAQTGNWSSTSTWTGGVVPTANDNVVIAARTVTINTSAFALNVIVGSDTNQGGTLKFETSTARTLVVGQSVTVKSDGTFSTETSNASSQTGHALAVGENINVAGKLDFSTNPNFTGNNAAAKIVFNGANNSTFSGSGVFNTDVREIELTKSGGAAVELNFPNPPTPGNSLTVRGTTNDPVGFLTLTSGLLKISGNFPISSPLFKTPAYTIPATSGIWLSNANFTVAGTASGQTTSNDGLLRVTQGTYNIGIG